MTAPYARFSGVVPGVVLAVALASGGAEGCAPARADGAVRYVALGDSFAAGPLIPHHVDGSGLCLRSDHGYPALLAKKLKVRSFRNVSCAGAKIGDLTSGDSPQLDAVKRKTTLVTVSVGGNDIGFARIALTCLSLGVTDPRGAPCRKAFVQNGTDKLRARIDATAPKITKLLKRIHSRAPRARVVVVGYLRMLPSNGPRCFPELPVADGDVRYLAGVQRKLNAMLAARAGANDATYAVDYAPGHDICADRHKWVEGIFPGRPAAPVHPNAAGMRATANAIAQVAD